MKYLTKLDLISLYQSERDYIKDEIERLKEFKKCLLNDTNNNFYISGFEYLLKSKARLHRLNNEIRGLSC
jgi:hypothetical protein